MNAEHRQQVAVWLTIAGAGAICGLVVAGVGLSVHKPPGQPYPWVVDFARSLRLMTLGAGVLTSVFALLAFALDSGTGLINEDPDAE